MSETVTIPRRPGWSFLAALEVSIECGPLVPHRFKLGLAVRAAYKTGAVLTGVVLRGAVLTGADLTGVVLRGAVLTGADLTGADLTGAVLRGAVLTGADLTGAVLTGADLRGADLTGAGLTGAVLTGADLTGAGLTGAVLTGAVLTGAVLTGEKVKRLFASVNRLDGYTFLAFELEAGGVKIAAGCRWFTPAEYRAHVAAEYPDADKAAETLAILDFVEARAKALGIGLSRKRATARWP